MHMPRCAPGAYATQWSRDVFEGMFKQSGEDVNAYLSQPEYLAALERQPGVRRITLKEIHANLVDKPITLEQCVVWSRLKFEEHFCNSISQLLFNFPLEMNTSSGAPFWLASTLKTQPWAVPDCGCLRPPQGAPGGLWAGSTLPGGETGPLGCSSRCL